MKNYLLLIFIPPIIYIGSYGCYCWKKGNKPEGLGAFIAAAIPFILTIMMFITSS
ncbi:hypothetical protein [Lutispora thermophila]|uniref:Uncharacterized protein n=1 Tax=Lutispora thermophila DSM 19022 TaxID=1122184 RepID=A0A1M6DTU0_9FIRM|nr:hypothetical protein [Lutispora thermophila]SHI76664.1 hypothetical protein SAMN02745176_01290 [Lutispora thermophila DSM 19022]